MTVIVFPSDELILNRYLSLLQSSSVTQSSGAERQTGWQCVMVTLLVHHSSVTCSCQSRRTDRVASNPFTSSGKVFFHIHVHRPYSLRGHVGFFALRNIAHRDVTGWQHWIDLMETWPRREYGLWRRKPRNIFGQEIQSGGCPCLERKTYVSSL